MCENENNGEKKQCKCEGTQKFLLFAIMANTITSLALALVSVSLVCIIGLGVYKIYQPKFEPAQQPKEVVKEQIQEQPNMPTAAFHKKTMSFDKAIKAKKPMIILFYADWCPHCQRFAPTFQKLSNDWQLRFKMNFVAINVEDPGARILLERFQVKAFPSLFMMNPRTGKIVFIPNNVLVGENAQHTLKEIFKDFANKANKTK